MNEKQVRRLRQAMGFKNAHNGREYKATKHKVRRLIKDKLKRVTVKTLFNVDQRWRYLRLKDVIREAKRL